MSDRRTAPSRISLSCETLAKRRSTSRAGCFAMAVATSSRCPRGHRLAKGACWASGVAQGMRTAFVPTLALARGETRWRCLMPMVAVWRPLPLVASTDPSSVRTTAGRLAARPSARQTNRSYWPTRPRWSSTSGWPSRRRAEVTGSSFTTRIPPRRHSSPACTSGWGRRSVD